MASRKPSYRRNRDYSKSFKWTYDLDKDLYECYLLILLIDLVFKL